MTDLNSPVDWALFGYEGQSSVLKVISTGEDGIEELMEDLNPSKIMYGFLSVQDPKTSLPKYVLLNWQVYVFKNLKALVFRYFNGKNFDIT